MHKLYKKRYQPRRKGIYRPFVECISKVKGYSYPWFRYDERYRTWGSYMLPAYVQREYHCMNVPF